MTDTSTEAVERLAGVMPRYFGIWSSTGVHVGVWDDGHIAESVLADEYPNGKLVEMVGVLDAGAYAATLAAERDALQAKLDRALGAAMQLASDNMPCSCHECIIARATLAAIQEH